MILSLYVPRCSTGSSNFRSPWHSEELRKEVDTWVIVYKISDVPSMSSNDPHSLRYIDRHGIERRQNFGRCFGIVVLQHPCQLRIRIPKKLLLAFTVGNVQSVER